MAYRTILLLLAVGLIVSAGLFHGRIVDRWGNSDELNEAAACVQRVKETIGDWVSAPFPMNPKQLEAAEVVSHISRTYVNKSTGERVSILLICGRPGPISVHTPDICYQGAGYKMGQKTLQAIRGEASNRPSEFWAARFTKEPDPEPLHILWAWSDGGIFLAPDHPRLVFYRAKALYKLYVIRHAKTLDAPLVDTATQVFLKDFLPELRNTLSGLVETPEASAQ